MCITGPRLSKSFHRGRRTDRRVSRPSKAAADGTSDHSRRRNNIRRWLGGGPSRSRTGSRLNDHESRTTQLRSSRGLCPKVRARRAAQSKSWRRCPLTVPSWLRLRPSDAPRRSERTARCPSTRALPAPQKISRSMSLSNEVCLIRPARARHTRQVRHLRPRRPLETRHPPTPRARTHNARSGADMSRPRARASGVAVPSGSGATRARGRRCPRRASPRCRATPRPKSRGAGRTSRTRRR